MIGETPVPRLGTPKKQVGVNRLSRSGHNILEVMISCLIFSTLMVSMSLIWGQYYRVQQHSRNHLAAAALARQVLEEHLSGGYDSPINQPGVVMNGTVVSKTKIRNRNADCSFNYQFQSFARGGGDFREYIVTVSWNDGATKEIRYDTFVHRSSK